MILFSVSPCKEYSSVMTLKSPQPSGWGNSLAPQERNYLPPKAGTSLCAAEIISTAALAAVDDKNDKPAAPAGLRHIDSPRTRAVQYPRSCGAREIPQPGGWGDVRQKKPRNYLVAGRFQIRPELPRPAACRSGGPACRSAESGWLPPGRCISEPRGWASGAR